MISIIHKILVLIKNHLNFLKDNNFECFFKEYNIISNFFFFFFKKFIIFEEENIIEDIRNHFRLKKDQNYSGIKEIRNIYRQEK